MTSYRITYQIRRKASVSVLQGDWQDKESVVVAGEDARGAVNEIANNISVHDFRLRGVEIIGQVDAIEGV